MTASFNSHQVLVVGYMVFNFLSSVGIINLNKLVFKTYGFNFPTFLTGIHFVLTFIGLCACNMAGQKEHTRDRRVAPRMKRSGGCVMQ
jgi:hypothetical protein